MQSGINRITIPNNEVTEFLKTAKLPADYGLSNNDYLIVSNENGKVIAKWRVKDNKFRQLTTLAIGGKGEKPFIHLNDEQECAFDLLSDDSVRIKVLTGIAGSGKTKMAIKFAIEKLKRKEIKKIILIRQPSHVGEQLGFHKGDKDTKMANWNKPMQDNMAQGAQYFSFENLVEKKIIEMDIPSEMKGRDLKDCWIIVDEAEDLTEAQFKLLGERVAEGSVVIFTGDVNQVTDRKYRDDNGLRRSYGLRGKTNLFGCITLVENVRSDVSKVFSSLY